MLELIPFLSNNDRAVRYDPFREMEEFEKRFFGRRNTSSFSTDIKDNGTEYLLEAELPGFGKEDIDVSVDGDYLTIRAERKYETDEKDDNGKFIRCERSYGSFSRSFDISDIDAGKIGAEYTDGILKLTMPKKEKVMPEVRKVKIK